MIWLKVKNMLQDVHATLFCHIMLVLQQKGKHIQLISGASIPAETS